MEGSNALIHALEGVKHIRSQEGTILTEPFLDVCKRLLPLIDTFGSSMSCVKSNVTSNIRKLELKYLSNPSAYRNLHSIALEEVKAKTARSVSSCTSALVWLIRSMDFTVQLFRNVSARPDWSFSESCTDSYNKTLRKWHGWLAISTFSFLIKLAPERSKFLEAVFGKNRRRRSDDIENFCSIFTALLQENHKFFASVGVDDIKAP